MNNARLIVSAALYRVELRFIAVVTEIMSCTECCTSENIVKFAQNCANSLRVEQAVDNENPQCCWDQYPTHPLAFHFAHNPLYGIYHEAAATPDGIKGISFLLYQAEAKLSRDWYGGLWEEAVLTYTAHVLYLTVVQVPTQAVSAMRTAAKTGKVQMNNYFETGLDRVFGAPEKASYWQSPYGVHFQTLTSTANVAIVGINIANQLISQDYHQFDGARLRARANGNCTRRHLPCHPPTRSRYGRF